MAKQWTKSEARQEARRFAVAQLENQDQPDWCDDAGVPEHLWPVFNDEMKRIAARIRSTIKGGAQ
jgi:hypothetical protein